MFCIYLDPMQNFGSAIYIYIFLLFRRYGSAYICYICTVISSPIMSLLLVLLK